MRVANRYFLLLAAAVLAQWAVPALSGVPFGQPFVLGVGESIVLGNDEAELHFDGISSDSRCPLEVPCFWEGDAAADLRFSTPAGDSVDLILHTYSGFERSATIEPYVITLQRVLPVPVLDEPIDPLSYLVQVVVYQGSVRSERWPWGKVKARYH